MDKGSKKSKIKIARHLKISFITYRNIKILYYIVI